MITLAFDSSAKSASSAVLNDGKLVGQYFQNSGLTHSRTLMAMASDLLGNLEIKPSDIDLIAVSNGPGSFTGIRIGVSAAKGLAWGLDTPVCGVSALEAMAYQFSQPDCLLCPVMDARRGQVYNALFTTPPGSGGSKPDRVCDDRAIALETLAPELIAFGKPCILLGDGAEIAFYALTSAGVDCRMAPELVRFQTAFGVALAAGSKPSVPASLLEPFYLRPSQAERERLRLLSDFS